MADHDQAAVLACIRKHHERLDFEISAETGAPLAAVRQFGSELVAKGAVIACVVTRFNDGERIDASLYRVAGYVPPPGGVATMSTWRRPPRMGTSSATS
jgi:hypothetical protein